MEVEVLTGEAGNDAPARPNVGEDESLKVLLGAIKSHLENTDDTAKKDLVGRLAKELQSAFGKEKPGASAGPAKDTRSRGRSEGYAPGAVEKEKSEKTGKVMESAARKAEVEDSLKDKPAARPAGSPAPAATPDAGLAGGRPMEPGSPAEDAEAKSKVADPKSKARERHADKKGLGEWADAEEEAEVSAEGLRRKAKGKKVAEARRALRLQQKGVQIQVAIPSSPKVRAIMLTYKARELREKNTQDVQSLLLSASLLKQAIQLQPNLKLAKIEMKELAKLFKAMKKN
jgi:hypothetical protein